MTGSGEDKTKEKLEHCVLYSHHGASLVFSVKWLWQLWGLRSSPSYMAQTVGIRLNMLALYQASSLSKSIKHDFTTATEHMCVCLRVCVFVCGRGGEVVRQTEQREKYLHEKGERFRREGGAGCQVLLLTAAVCWKLLFMLFKALQLRLQPGTSIIYYIHGSVIVKGQPPHLFSLAGSVLGF